MSPAPHSLMMTDVICGKEGNEEEGMSKRNTVACVQDHLWPLVGCWQRAMTALNSDMLI